MRRTMLRALRLAFLALPSLLAAQTTELVVYLEGRQAVPPSTSTATGFGLLRVTEPANTLSAFAFLGTPTATVELRLGSSGQNGNLVLPLVAGANGTWTAQTTLGSSVVAALKSGGTHLQATPSAGGVVRGQVGVSRSSRVIAFCNGLQVVPSTMSSATASWYCWLYEPENRLVYSGTTTLPASTARLMRGDAVSNGPLVANLTMVGSTGFGVTDRLDPAVLADLRFGSTYVEHRTSAYPNGEIRGQVRLSVGNFVTHASGSQVVPPTASAAEPVLAAELLVDTRLVLRWTGLPLASGQTLTIRKGAAGQVGALVLTATPSGGTATTRALSSPEIADLRNGLWYVSWMTNATLYPDGEARGNLAPVALPIAFAEGPPIVGGGRPVASWQGVPVLGQPFRVTVLGGGSGAPQPAALLLGATRVAPLAFDLGTLGMTGSFLVHDLLLDLPTTTGNDGNAWIDFLMPVDKTLRGGTLYGSWFVVAPGTNPFGAVTSSALAIVVH